LLTSALAFSKNTVSVKLADTLGIDAVISFARRAGITTDLPPTLSLALGAGEVLPIDLVNAYATIAAQGFYTAPVMVLRVRDRQGKVLEEYTPAQAPPPLAAPANAIPENAPSPGGDEGEPGALPNAPQTAPRDHIEPAVAFVLESMMRGVIDRGTGIAARALERPAAGKTGTTSDHRDAWFVGFTPSLVAGVWVGFDYPKTDPPLGPGETGAKAALPAWLRFMQATVGGRPSVEFQPPGNVEFARIDPETGLLARETALSGTADPAKEIPFVAFLAGTAPVESAPDPDVSGTAPQSFFEDDH
jgi:penicillin-binding protein 1A